MQLSLKSRPLPLVNDLPPNLKPQRNFILQHMIFMPLKQNGAKCYWTMRFPSRFIERTAWHCCIGIAAVSKDCYYMLPFLFSAASALSPLGGNLTQAIS